MKSLKEFRGNISDYKIGPLGSRLKYFKQKIFDWDVYLYSKKMNLQREFVWTLDQKREIILSILLRRHIPHMAFINTLEDVYLVIDGKQRLSSMFDFMDDKFTIELEGKELYFSHLPSEYKDAILHYDFQYYIMYEDYNAPLTDEVKIKWFNFINFAGTPQDKEHMQKLIN